MLAGGAWLVPVDGSLASVADVPGAADVPDGWVVAVAPEDDGVDEGVEPALAVPDVEGEVVPDVVPVDVVDVPPDDALVVPVEGAAPLVVLLDDVDPVPEVVVVSVVGCDVPADVVVVLRGGGESTGGSTGSALQSSAMTCMPGRVSVIEPFSPGCGLAPNKENGPIEAIESGAPDQ